MAYLTLLAAGALLAGSMCLALNVTARQSAKDILTLLLAFIAAIYVGPLIGTTASVQYIEYSFALALTAWCVFALRRGAEFLAIGYVLHGLWDALHPALLPHVLPHWYAPLCIGFDFTVALYLFFMLDKPEQ